MQFLLCFLLYAWESVSVESAYVCMCPRELILSVWEMPVCSIRCVCSILMKRSTCDILLQHTRITLHHHGNTSPDHATEPECGVCVCVVCVCVHGRACCVCVCVTGSRLPLCEVVFSVGMLWQLTESEVNYWSYFVCRSPEWFISRFNSHTLEYS